MPMSERICGKCGKPTKLMLPIGGKGPRTHRCIHCDIPDPIERPDVKRLLQGELARQHPLKPPNR